jgi:adenosylmethionine-8-amino-7-oxononanoate aminotransferase
VPGPDIEKMTRMFAEHGDQIAAVITEPVQGAGGVYPPPEGYLEALRRLCDDHSVYLVFDEVITGFGRLGTWFAAQHYGVVPDMITFAKAVTSGYQPLGGVICGPGVSEALQANEGFVLRHGYTYSGHPAACAAGVEAIRIQTEEGLVNRAAAIGRRLGEGLVSLATDGAVAQVRGVGGIWAVQLHDDQDPMAVRDRILAEGVIVRPVPGNSLAVCPPLVITDGEMDRVVDAVAGCIG